MGLDEGFTTIADAIRSAGGVDAVIGFSQGACAAGMVASLLEPDRPAAFSSLEAKGGVPYPTSFKEFLSQEGQKQLKFAVSYCGFRAPGPMYDAFYEPKISTPTLHFIGSLDSVVEEGRSLALVEGCVGGKEKGRVVYHPGGHFVPIGREMVGVLVGFIRECCEEDKKVEEGVEDMDVPF